MPMDMEQARKIWEKTCEKVNRGEELTKQEEIQGLLAMFDMQAWDDQQEAEESQKSQENTELRQK